MGSEGWWEQCKFKNCKILFHWIQVFFSLNKCFPADCKPLVRWYNKKFLKACYSYNCTDHVNRRMSLTQNSVLSTRKNMELFYLLAYSPNSHNGHDRIRMPSKSPMWVQGPKDLSHPPLPSQIRSEAAGTQTGAHLRCWCHRQSLTYCVMVLTPEASLTPTCQIFFFFYVRP